MMRVKVLKAPTGSASNLVRYYADTAPGVSDYYVDPAEPEGQWWGAGVAAVGLDGPVEAEQLANMFNARLPVSGARAGRGFGVKSVRGFDATFSAPKSVSLLWALGDESTRASVLAAHDAAVEATLSWFQGHGCLTRRGANGIHQVDAEGLVVGLFRQHTSRMLDPQLHTHAVIWSKVQDATGAWLALDAGFLLDQQMTMSWLYDATLRSELTARLGVDWEPRGPGDGQANIAGIPAEVLDGFSQRSAQVDAKLAELLQRWEDEHDRAEPDPRDVYLLTRRAAASSRPGKTLDVNVDDLRREWADRADELGFDPGDIPVFPPSPRPVLDEDQIVRAALARVSGTQSEWIEADLVREVAVQLPATLAPAQVIAVSDRLGRSAAQRCVELHPPVDGPRRRDGRPIGEHVLKRRLTTPPILEQEHRLLAWAHANNEPPAAETTDHDTVAEAVAGRGRLVLVVGPAGSGKTTAIRAGVEQLRTQHRRVLGLAPSGKAADVLAETTGAHSVTLAKLLHTATTGRRLPERGTTLILDEAGMASTEDLDHLTTLADRNGWRLVAVGDPDQLPSVSRGGMFAHWTEALPAHRLEVVHRFQEPWQRDASLALRRGDPAAAEEYASRGRARTVHPAVLAQHVARLHQRVAARGESLAITTASAATALEINAEIQRLTSHSSGVALADGSEARIGDRIATRRNLNLETDRGFAVRNRHQWIVDAIRPDGSLVVSDPDRGTVTLPADYVADAVELGWAVTGYGNQGITTDHALCIVEPATTRAGLYVGLTRGRGHNTALIVDPTGLVDETEALIAALTRPPSMSTALATRDRLYREHGLEPPALDPADVVARAPGRSHTRAHTLGL